MGIIANIFRTDGQDCSNGGLSAHHSQVCVVNAPGPFEPSKDVPAVYLRRGAMGSVNAAPVDTSEGGSYSMGGCFIHSSDSRFRRTVEEILGTNFYGAVALHDRLEKY